MFADEFPDRFFNAGVAEQNLVGMAAGLASCGKTVFISTFAVFAPGRCFDQLRIAVAYSNMNVKLAATHAGIMVGEDGASHQAIEDIALARSLPGFRVIVPADEFSAGWATRAAASTFGPFYLRLGRPKYPVIYNQDQEFEIGKAVYISDGGDATIIANGRLVAEALEASAILAAKGISVRVLDMHTAEPLDREAIVKAAADTGALVVAEEHLLNGGLGSGIAQIVAEERPSPMEFVAIRQRFGQSGDPQQLLEVYELTAKFIVEAVEKAVARKR
jgi:transketolase